MNIIEGSLLYVPEGVLCQQVNCRGVMGSGLALKMRHRFPAAAEAYFAKKDWKPGDALFVQVAPLLYIGHLAGQDGYGEQGRRTDYPALEKALVQARDFAASHGLVLCLPHGLGCGLAGGDWRSVSWMIEQTCPRARIYRLPGDRAAGPPAPR